MGAAGYGVVVYGVVLVGTSVDTPDLTSINTTTAYMESHMAFSTKQKKDISIIIIINSWRKTLAVYIFYVI